MRNTLCIAQSDSFVGMETAGQRLKRAIFKRNWDDVAAFARALRKNPVTVRQHTNRGNIPVKDAEIYGRRLKVPTDWLLFGKGPEPSWEGSTMEHMGNTPDQLPAYQGDLNAGLIEIGGEEYAAIGRFEQRLSAGPGSLLETEPQPLGYAIYERQWLNAITRAAPSMLALVQVDGPSMYPTLSDGDWVLVDKTQTRVAREGIFAFRVSDAVWVKRLSLNLREQLVRIISDNTVTPPQDMPEDELEIIGRVVWIVGRKV